MAYMIDIRGELFIVSGYETYEQKAGSGNYLELKNEFHGTIVTTTFNLEDNNSYIYDDSESYDSIIF